MDKDIEKFKNKVACIIGNDILIGQMHAEYLPHGRVNVALDVAIGLTDEQQAELAKQFGVSLLQKIIFTGHLQLKGQARDV